MTPSNPPRSIENFQRALFERDGAGMRAAFSADAVLIDGESRYVGGEIRTWTDRLCQRPSLNMHPLHVIVAEPDIILAIDVDGEATSNANWHIRLSDGQIEHLRVESVILALPPVVATFIKSMNGHDLGGMVSCFSPDAIANDQRRQFVGTAEIEAWLAKEIVGDHVTIFVADIRRTPGGVAILGQVTGDYDKTGLPNPLPLHFYFSVANGRIGQLVIVPGQFAA